MHLNGADLVVKALADEGITHAFGIPGTHNIELYDALGPSSVRPILVTDEQSAGFMADGYWRASGRLACVNLVPGAGFTHALSGIAEAWMDGVPLLVLGCGIRRDVRKAYQLHDIDQLAMATPVTKATFRPMSGAELYPTVRQACAIARAGTPGPVMIEVPVNLYLARHEVDPGTLIPPVPPASPSRSSEELTQAAEFLSRSRSMPLLYLGLGSAPAGADLVRLAETLGAPVATTIQGKGVFPESHPLFLWNGFGNAAPPFVRSIAAECDRVLAIGCRFSEVGTGGYGLELPGPLCHVDINPEVLGRNFPAEVTVAADAGVFVRALLGALSGHSSVVGGLASAVMPNAGAAKDDPAKDVAIRIATGHAAVRHHWAEHRSPTRVSPPLLLERLQALMGPETVFTTDSGNGTFLAMECLRLERPGRFLAPVDYSCMGYSVPAAIGAKLARPEIPVIALAGDGAFLMTGLECLTAASNHIAVGVIVLRDQELAQISQFQETAFNRPVASGLPDYDLAALARGMGIEALKLDRDADIDSVLQGMRARLEEGRPVIVDAAVDYSEKTWFTRGVVKTMLGRLPWKDRVRFVARALVRRVTG
jgi:acetolactate synthase-1/2/3 large subunit